MKTSLFLHPSYPISIQPIYLIGLDSEVGVSLVRPYSHPFTTAAGHVLHASASTSHVPSVLDNDLHLLSQPPRQVIMPAVDIEQPVSADDPYGQQDYVDLGLDGDGLGTDDFAGNDAGQDPALHNFSSEPGAAPSVALKPLPAWFTDLVAQNFCNKKIAKTVLSYIQDMARSGY